MEFAVSQQIVERVKHASVLSAKTEPNSDVFRAAVKNLDEGGLSEVLYTTARKPGSYGERIDSYWSLTPRVRPWAIVQPRNTAEVFNALVALVKTEGCEFAVRSGGHMCYPGSNSIRDGFTIDLGLMNATEYNPETKLASIQPGCRWTNVYTYLEEHQVVKYEIVLADGTIANASESVNPDLFRALKGGSNNFGIVTRFDMETFPAHDVYDGIVTFPPSSTDAVIDAFVDFTKQLHVVQDAHILAMWVSMSKRDISLLNGIVPDPTQPPDLTMVSMINMIMTQLDGVEKSPSLEKCMSIPNPVSNTMMHTTLAKKVAGFLIPSNREDIWFTLTYKLDKRIIEKTTEVYERLVKDINERSPGCVIQMVLQPLPTTFGQHSAARGGNMLGLERFKEDSVLFIAAVEGSTPGFYEMAFPITKAAIHEIEDFAKEVGGDVGFRYLNYCDGSQDPLGSYSEENIRKMKDAATKYDPTSVFQTRVPGGFKLSKVNRPVQKLSPG
ncbi:hypothetical protein SCAR479_13299 [Seiridium cardinale]|uniref:FAD-binding PCMH-type domain-containing protein n=1 Tax=Seiridium cardinale TaxID=138064 RepID=A0ABR2X8C0_9PEZI